jgi:copper chaperone CopZ
VCGALEQLPGVAQATADVATQTATCTVDPQKFDAQKAIAVLADIGFEGGHVVKDQPKQGDPPAGAE